VQDDADRGGQIVRQVAHEVAQRVDPSGGCADADDPRDLRLPHVSVSLRRPGAAREERAAARQIEDLTTPIAGI
jgi:hypothetical protein